MERSMLSWVCVLALVALPLVGCSEETAAAGGTGGSGDTRGDGGSGGSVAAPGALISAEKIDPFGDGMNAWRVLYGSEAIDGTPIEVSGIVAAPSEPPSEGLRDVVAYAHGTTGLFDGCAYSNNPVGWLFDTLVPLFVRNGYVAVVTDYEGLGTPGIHPYHVGVSEGRGVVDIVRAARQIDEVYSGSRAVVWGISQGGHAALFAGEIAPDWAPDVDVMGVIAAAPTGDLQSVFRGLAGVAEVKGYLWQITLSYEATYGLALQDVYDPETLATIRELADQEVCADAFLEPASDVANAGFVTNPADLPPWEERFRENSPGYVRTEMPVLILQRSGDVIVPQWETDILYDRLCNIGSQTDYRVFEGQGHAESLTLQVPDALDWTAARFAGELASNTCPN